MLSLRAHAILCGALFAAIVIMAAVGNALAGSSLIRDPAAFRLPAMVLFFTLFVAFGFSTVPVMVKLVLHAQRAIGNESQPLVKALAARERVVIWILWGLMAAGLALAVPAAIAAGAFAAPAGAPPAGAGQSAAPSTP
jgi:hypothetical protein